MTGYAMVYWSGEQVLRPTRLRALSRLFRYPRSLPLQEIRTLGTALQVAGVGQLWCPEIEALVASAEKWCIEIGDLDTLVAEHRRIFGAGERGAGGVFAERVLVPARECMYVGEDPEALRTELGELYVSQGFEWNRTNGVRGPGHVSTQLEYMAALASEGEPAADELRSFFVGHVQPWMPLFAVAVESEARNVVLRLAACALAVVLDRETRLLVRFASTGPQERRKAEGIR